MAKHVQETKSTKQTLSNMIECEALHNGNRSLEKLQEKVPPHLRDKSGYADRHSLHSQIVLPVVFGKQLLIQREEFRRSFTTCSNFVEKTAPKTHDFTTYCPPFIATVKVTVNKLLCSSHQSNKVTLLQHCTKICWQFCFTGTEVMSTYERVPLHWWLASWSTGFCPTGHSGQTWQRACLQRESFQDRTQAVDKFLRFSQKLLQYTALGISHTLTAVSSLTQDFHPPSDGKWVSTLWLSNKTWQWVNVQPTEGSKLKFAAGCKS